MLALPACEALRNSETGDDFSSVFVSACLRSCSYAALRAICLGYSNEAVMNVVGGWWSVRRQLGLPTGRFQEHQIREFFEIVLSVTDDGSHSRSKSDVIGEALLEYERTNDFSAHIWNRLTEGIRGLPNQSQLVDGPRESRVPYLQELLSSVVSMPSTRGFDRDCLIGYAVNQLAPGTLEHVGILKPLAELYPTAHLWYGVFAGLYQSEKPQGFFSSTAAALLMRELERPAWSIGAPSFDVTLDELVMLQEASKAPPKARGLVAGQLCVSLLPGVEISLRTTGKDAGEFSANSVDDRVQRSQIQQALVMIDRLRAQIATVLSGKSVSNAAEEPLPSRAGSDSSDHYGGGQPELFPKASDRLRRFRKGRKVDV